MLRVPLGVACALACACSTSSSPSSGHSIDHSAPNQGPVQSASASEDTSLYLIDMLRLKPGVPASQADEYFSRITPVIAKHGLQNVYHFAVNSKLAGTAQPQLVNVWSMSGAETMSGIQSDPDYQANVAFRNATFDMAKAEMFIAEATIEPSLSSAPLLFVDLLNLNPGVDPAQAKDYFSTIIPVVESHGLVPIARFKVRKNLSGSISPELINIWTMADTHTMPNIQSDERYKANIPLRNATFKMASASMYTLRPAEHSPPAPHQGVQARPAKTSSTGVWKR